MALVPPRRPGGGMGAGTIHMGSLGSASAAGYRAAGGWPDYDPAVEALDGWWRADYPGGTPPPQWRGSASAGPSGIYGLNCSSGNAPDTTGAQLNGFTVANFNGTNDQLDYASGSSTFVSAAAGSVSYLFNADAMGTNNAIGNNPALLKTSGSFLLIEWINSGLKCTIWDTNYRSISLAATSGSWLAVQMRWNGTTMEARLGRTAWSSIACGNIGGLFQMYVGASGTTGPYFFDGRIADIIMKKTRLDNATMDNILNYYCNRYAFPNI